MEKKINNTPYWLLVLTTYTIYYIGTLFTQYTYTMKYEPSLQRNFI